MLEDPIIPQAEQIGNPPSGNSVIMAVGQSTTLTVQFSSPLDAAPTAAPTGNVNIISVGAVTSLGNNTYSVPVTANSGNIATVTFTGAVGGVPMTVISGPIIITTPATILTITGPSSPPLGQTAVYTISANGMINGNPEVSFSKPSTATVSLGPVELQPNGTWQFSMLAGGSTSPGNPISLFATATVNGQVLTGGLQVTLPTPTITISPSPLNLMAGQSLQITVTTNFPLTDPPLLSSASGSLIWGTLTGGPTVWSGRVTASQALTSTLTATTTYNNSVVSTQINVVASAPPTATFNFSPPTGP